MSNSQIVHVIDDDVAVRQSMAFLLSTAGYAVRVHESATGFLKSLPGADSGCIITDVRMPGMDGLELQSRLKAMNVALPVIVITGHGDIGLAVRAMKAGAVDFIEKPFDDDVLLAAIRSALARNLRSRPRRPRRAGRRKAEQDHCPRPWDKCTNRRGISRKRHDQDARRQPVGTGANGDFGGERALGRP